MTYIDLLRKYNRLLPNIFFLTEKSVIVLEKSLIDNSIQLDNMTVMMDLRTNEGENLPHFHIFTSDGKDGSKKLGKNKKASGKNKKRFHTCVRLDVADYFHHSNKEGVLSNSQIKALVRVLKSPYYGDKRYTTWEYAVYLWRMMYPNSKMLPEGITMPDYNELKGK